jgi:DNA polymerase I-like protein with 3'-5' exonuclease and polymerase domains
VALTINRIWKNLYENVPGVEVLLQVHDSLAGQFPTQEAASYKAKIQEAAKVIIPYPDPLIIPFGLKTSTQSWGHCK